MSTNAAIATNPILQLQDFGQSVWLDYIRRSLITSGELKRLMSEDGLRGVTSNPSPKPAEAPVAKPQATTPDQKTPDAPPQKPGVAPHR